MYEVPYYGLRAYALLYSKYGSREAFRQSVLDWMVSESMKKKIFAVLLWAGWIKKVQRNMYKCIAPEDVFKHLLDFKVPQIMKDSTKPYAFTGLSAVEIWSDYSYVQRAREKSPYFIKVLKQDLKYWKSFFNERNVPCYVNSGTSIGEFVILIPVNKLTFNENNGLKVDTVKTTMDEAKKNEMFSYAYDYIKKKYGVI